MSHNLLNQFDNLAAAIEGAVGAGFAACFLGRGILKPSQSFILTPTVQFCLLAS